MFIDLFASFSFVIFVCSLKVNLVSKVTPSLLGCLTVGICVLFIVSVRVVLYSAGSGVKSVDDDLSGFVFSCPCVELV